MAGLEGAEESVSEALDQGGVLARLHEALLAAGTPHVFVGALPVLAWGRPRSTTDFDLVVYCGPTDLERLTAALAARGIDRKSDFPSSDPADPLPDMVIFWTAENPSVRVDVFVAKLEFERAVLATAKEATIFGTRLMVASPEASIIYKLIAHRSKDVGDVG